MRNTLFVVIEGIDGSGKSETVKGLHNYLFSRHKSYRILTTREPTGGQYGTEIRRLLVEDSDPQSNHLHLLDLFVKDRREHVDKTIHPFLDQSSEGELNVVLCDRYYYSTVAFQAAQGLDIHDLIAKNAVFLKPDIAFFLDIDPKIALDRIADRSKEKFEHLHIMEKIRANYQQLPELLDDNIVVIDAARQREAVLDDVIANVNALL